MYEFSVIERHLILNQIKIKYLLGLNTPTGKKTKNLKYQSHFTCRKNDAEY